MTFHKLMRDDTILEMLAFKTETSNTKHFNILIKHITSPYHIPTFPPITHSNYNTFTSIINGWEPQCTAFK